MGGAADASAEDGFFLGVIASGAAVVLTGESIVGAASEPSMAGERVGTGVRLGESNTKSAAGRETRVGGAVSLWSAAADSASSCAGGAVRAIGAGAGRAFSG